MTIWNVLFLLLQLIVYQTQSEVITAYNDFGLAPIDPEIADVVDWKHHACRRTCKNNEVPLDCYYTFKLEYYNSMSKACYNCPFNTTDCFRSHCIPADGIKRSLMVVNRQMPGPPIEVCQGDRIIVDMVNLLHAESTTMHWHGQHHVRTPYMDGVPYVSQCPIQPEATFRYNYIATEAGTHFWHSHTGFQRGDGVFGPLIVRVPPKIDWHKDLYDYDENTIVIADWIHELGLNKFLAHYHSDGDNKAPNLLINGLGRFTIKNGNETQTAMPVTTFVVKPSFRYRFRVINAEFLNCPIEISVDNHTLYVVSSDGRDLEPVQAESLVTYAGERFDFILEMNQPVDNYWMRFRGLMDCDERFLSAYQVAILRYEGAPEQEPLLEVSYNRTRNDSYGLQVNALNEGTESNNSISMPLLNATDDDDPSNTQEPEYQFYISFDFYAKDHPHFHRKNLYGFHQVKKSEQVLTPQFNHISMKLPPFPLLPQRHLITPNQFCNSSTVKKCESEFCACTHVLQVKRKSVVELVLIDEGVPFEANHPFHLHGYQFRVVAMKKLGDNTTVDEVKELDRQGLIHRKLKRAPLKDTVTVPDGGYTIVRFYADNPGYWLFHCHIEFHADIGMSLIFKVGEDDEIPPVPTNFPTCGDFKPVVNENEKSILNHLKDNATSTNIIETTRQKQSKSDKLLADVIKRFAIYTAYFEQLLNLRTSSASISSITLPVLIACVSSSVMRLTNIFNS
ncbi:hypothetical protein PUN28_016084 [Cardiocondyla obscurior]